ncbi:Hypothetical protein RADP37_03989 [Roseomonas mucosa]|uniref:Uncharacterized protein n=1 Tax=Roseomonas mucosa TaxID=207340 RepID=A0A4Y1MT78_9PROT|nr:Hypothetical protein RADP37_03989 [Roseomonas mucosa]
MSGPFGSHVAGLGVLPHAAGVAHGRPAAVEALHERPPASAEDPPAGPAPVMDSSPQAHPIARRGWQSARRAL